MSNTRRKDWLFSSHPPPQPGGVGRETEMFGFQPSPGQARPGQQALKRRVVMRQLVVIPQTGETSGQAPVLRTLQSSVTTLLCV